jgi:hypothetical protein
MRVARRESNSFVALTLLVCYSVFVFVAIAFLSAGHIANVDVKKALGLCLYLFALQFYWWFQTMQQAAHITSAFKQVLLALKRTRADSSSGTMWGSSDDYNDFMSLAQERSLTHAPGFAIFGRTIDTELVIIGSKGFGYILVVMVGRVVWSSTN